MVADRQLTAAITKIHNTLKRKSQDAIIWQDASEGALLYDRDAVKTASNSSAVIQFGEGSILQMQERTLVIIRRLEMDPFINDKRSFMVLIEGELRCKLPASNQKSAALEPPPNKRGLYSKFYLIVKFSNVYLGCVSSRRLKLKHERLLKRSVNLWAIIILRAEKPNLWEK